jgi:hypothetical protein
LAPRAGWAICGLFVELADLGLAVAGYFQEALGEFDGLLFGFGLLLLLFGRAYLLDLLIRRRRCGEIDRVWRLFLDDDEGILR